MNNLQNQDQVLDFFHDEQYNDKFNISQNEHFVSSTVSYTSAFKDDQTVMIKDIKQSPFIEQPPYFLQEKDVLDTKKQIAVQEEQGRKDKNDSIIDLSNPLAGITRVKKVALTMNTVGMIDFSGYFQVMGSDENMLGKEYARKMVKEQIPKPVNIQVDEQLFLIKECCKANINQINNKDQDAWAVSFQNQISMAENKKVNQRSLRIADIEATLGAILVQSELLRIPGMSDAQGRKAMGSFIFTMGANSDPRFNSFELGHYDNVPKRFPVPVVTSKDQRDSKGEVAFNCIARIFAKESTLFAVDISGHLWTWGVDVMKMRSVNNLSDIPVNRKPIVVQMPSLLHGFEVKENAKIVSGHYDTVNTDQIKVLNKGLPNDMKKKYDFANKTCNFDDIVNFAQDLDNRLAKDEFEIKNLVKKRERDEWRRKNQEFTFDDIDTNLLKIQMVDNDVQQKLVKRIALNNKLIETTMLSNTCLCQDQFQGKVQDQIQRAMKIYSIADNIEVNIDILSDENSPNDRRKAILSTILDMGLNLSQDTQSQLDTRDTNLISSFTKRENWNQLTNELFTFALWLSRSAKAEIMEIRENSEKQYINSLLDNAKKNLKEIKTKLASQKVKLERAKYDLEKFKWLKQNIVIPGRTIDFFNFESVEYNHLKFTRGIQRKFNRIQEYISKEEPDLEVFVNDLDTKILIQEQEVKKFDQEVRFYDRVSKKLEDNSEKKMSIKNNIQYLQECFRVIESNSILSKFVSTDLLQYQTIPPDKINKTYFFYQRQYQNQIQSYLASIVDHVSKPANKQGIEDQFMQAIHKGKLSIRQLEKVKNNPKQTHDPAYLHQWFVRLASTDWWSIPIQSEEWYTFEKDIIESYNYIFDNFSQIDKNNNKKVKRRSSNLTKISRGMKSMIGKTEKVNNASSDIRNIIPLMERGMANDFMFYDKIICTNCDYLFRISNEVKQEFKCQNCIKIVKLKLEVDSRQIEVKCPDCNRNLEFDLARKHTFTCTKCGHENVDISLSNHKVDHKYFLMLNFQNQMLFLQLYLLKFESIKYTHMLVKSIKNDNELNTDWTVIHPSVFLNESFLRDIINKGRKMDFPLLNLNNKAKDYDQMNLHLQLNSKFMYNFKIIKFIEFIYNAKNPEYVFKNREEIESLLKPYIDNQLVKDPFQAKSLQNQQDFIQQLKGKVCNLEIENSIDVEGNNILQLFKILFAEDAKQFQLTKVFIEYDIGKNFYNINEFKLNNINTIYNLSDSKQAKVEVNTENVDQLKCWGELDNNQFSLFESQDWLQKNQELTFDVFYHNMNLIYTKKQSIYHFRDVKQFQDFDFEDWYKDLVVQPDFYLRDIPDFPLNNKPVIEYDTNKTQKSFGNQNFESVVMNKANNPALYKSITDILYDSTKDDSSVVVRRSMFVSQKDILTYDKRFGKGKTKQTVQEDKVNKSDMEEEMMSRYQSKKSYNSQMVSNQFSGVPKKEFTSYETIKLKINTQIRMDKEISESMVTDWDFFMDLLITRHLIRDILEKNLKNDTNQRDQIKIQIERSESWNELLTFQKADSLYERCLEIKTQEHYVDNQKKEMIKLSIKGINEIPDKINKFRYLDFILLISDFSRNKSVDRIQLMDFIQFLMKRKNNNVQSRLWQQVICNQTIFEAQESLYEFIKFKSQIYTSNDRLKLQKLKLEKKLNRQDNSVQAVIRKVIDQDKGEIDNLQDFKFDNFLDNVVGTKNKIANKTNEINNNEINFDEIQNQLKVAKSNVDKLDEFEVGINKQLEQGNSDINKINNKLNHIKIKKDDSKDLEVISHLSADECLKLLLKDRKHQNITRKIKMHQEEHEKVRKKFQKELLAKMKSIDDSFLIDFCQINKIKFNGIDDQMKINLTDILMCSVDLETSCPQIWLKGKDEQQTLDSNYKYTNLQVPSNVRYIEKDEFNRHYIDDGEPIKRRQLFGDLDFKYKVCTVGDEHQIFDINQNKVYLEGIKQEPVLQTDPDSKIQVKDRKKNKIYVQELKVRVSLDYFVQLGYKAKEDSIVEEKEVNKSNFTSLTINNDDDDDKNDNNIKDMFEVDDEEIFNIDED